MWAGGLNGSVGNQSPASTSVATFPATGVPIRQPTAQGPQTLHQATYYPSMVGLRSTRRWDTLTAEERQEVDHHLARIRALNMATICPAFAAMFGVVSTFGASFVSGFVTLVSALTHLCTLSNPQRSQTCCSAVGCQLVFSLINACHCAAAIGVSTWVIVWASRNIAGDAEDRAFLAFAAVAVTSCTILLTLSLVIAIELHWVKGVLTDPATYISTPQAARNPPLELQPVSALGVGAGSPLPSSPTVVPGVVATEP